MLAYLTQMVIKLDMKMQMSNQSL